MPLKTIFKLNIGATIPSLGLGTWRAEEGKVGEAVKAALRVGYTHLDCAYVYENEAEIGKAIKESGVSRDKIFITSKLWNTFHRPELVRPAIVGTLKDLQLDHLDLYLMHWPLAHVNDGTGNSKKDANGVSIIDNEVTVAETWAAMEKLVDEGLVKSIGVSNFNIANLEALLKQCRIKPAMNQIELHPYLSQQALVDYCTKNDIVVTAYSPLGSQPKEGETTVLNDSTVLKIANKYGKTPAQVLISWAIQRDTVVIPKSSNPDRIAQNFSVFELSAEDMKALNALDRGKRYVDPSDWWKTDIFGDNAKL
jgi:diketogulonate reductase-like aldo/keto reductase